MGCLNASLFLQLSSRIASRCELHTANQISLKQFILLCLEASSSGSWKTRILHFAEFLDPVVCEPKNGAHICLTFGFCCPTSTVLIKIWWPLSSCLFLFDPMNPIFRRLRTLKLHATFSVTGLPSFLSHEPEISFRRVTLYHCHFVYSQNSWQATPVKILPLKPIQPQIC